MSGLTSTSDVTTKGDFDELLIEICSNDVRSAAGVHNIRNIFKNNIQLFNKYDKDMKLITLFHTVNNRLDVVFNTFKEIFKKDDNIDVVIKSDFFEVLMLIPIYFTRKDGLFCDTLLRILTPHCDCNRSMSSRHLWEYCWKYSPSVKLNIIIDTMIECAGDIFKEKFIKGLKPFQNSSVAKMMLSEILFSPKNKLIDLNTSAMAFYDNLAEMLTSKTYDNFTDNEKQDFHFCMLEFISLETYDYESLNVMQSFLKNNGKKLGICYYVRLMHKLFIVGLYTIRHFHDVIEEITSLETIWVNEVDELPKMNEIFNELLFSFINDINQRKNIVKNLKEFGKYIKIGDFFSLMVIFNDKGIHKSADLYKEFYTTLRRIYDDTLENGFKKINTEN